eukprot:tig00020713_g13412.t1
MTKPLHRWTSLHRWMQARLQRPLCRKRGMGRLGSGFASLPLGCAEEPRHYRLLGRGKETLVTRGSSPVAFHAGSLCEAGERGREGGREGPGGARGGVGKGICA